MTKEILVIDDNTDIRLLISGILKDQGLTVREAANFDQALSEINKKKMVTPYYTTKKMGTGLGLSIVTKIISDHNSTILFNSIKDGAKVEIAIPKYYD